MLLVGLPFQSASVPTSSEAMAAATMNVPLYRSRLSLENSPKCDCEYDWIVVKTLSLTLLRAELPHTLSRSLARSHARSLALLNDITLMSP